MKTFLLAAGAVAAVCACAGARERAAARDPRPETWFHLIGGNVSRAGLAADLEAIAGAGIGGIHLFHGSSVHGLWPGVDDPVECLSPKWDATVQFVARECRRLGLKFRMQNCPGWSMSGGPWIRPENAMRELACGRTEAAGGQTLRLADLALPEFATDDPDRDYSDIAVVAFPKPLGDEPSPLAPVSVETNADFRVYRFAAPVTIRTLRIESSSFMNHARTYDPECTVTFQAKTAGGGWRTVAREEMPPGSWQDDRRRPGRMHMMQTLACDEAVSSEWRLELKPKDPIRWGETEFLSAARMDNWEGLAGWTLRGLVDRGEPGQKKEAWVDKDRMLVVTSAVKDGWTVPGGEWIVLRFGHVNALRKNGPAPPEATGYECSKLDPAGVETNFNAYAGRLADGPLKGLVDGIVVDSWECFRQNWRDGMAEIFECEHGRDPVPMLPALFGWVVGTPGETWKFLREWRETTGGLVERNYYGRMAELAHARGMEIQFETAFGDVLAGDLLTFWKYADVPMCEFWHPARGTGLGSMAFKPMRPCVSAAHVYGKRRIAAEAFTQVPLDFKSTFRDLKSNANRAFDRGVTHLVFHTYTHNPQTGWKLPGTSFGRGIGFPFIRGQTWWKFMPEFTRYLSRITERLEAGRPVVDVLRVLGDALGHKPDEKDAFAGGGFKCDYANRDVLLNRLSASGGRLVLPDGMEYSVLWIPPGTFLLPESEKRIAELERAGARVVRGGEPDAVAGLVPDCRPLYGDGEILWYHRKDGGRDLYFVAAGTNGFDGKLEFRAKGDFSIFDPVSGERRPAPQDGGWHLAPDEAVFAEFGEPCDAAEDGDCSPETLARWDAHGEMAFERNFTLDGSGDGRKTILDLGRVEAWAEVFVNGKPVRKLWCYPYRCDISSACRQGENSIRVEVTSTWHNRMVRDAAKPEAERETWTLDGPGADEPPVPEGLFGPVAVTAE